MKKALVSAALVIVISLLAGCGGGASTGSDSDTVLAAQFRGAFQMNVLTSQCDLVRTEYNQSTGLPQQVHHYGYDELIFGSDNTGYRICGQSVWVGKFSGTMTQAASNTSTGSGTVSFNVFDKTGKASTQTGAITGSIFGTGGPTVVNFSMRNPTNTDIDTTLNVIGDNVAYRNSITGSYSTLAGIYNGKASGTSMSITSAGSISGKLAQGSFNGTITAFHADTQVHDISVTFTSNSGVSQTMTGVIGPYGALPGAFDIDGTPRLPNGDAHPGVLLAIASSNAAFADVFAQK